MSSKAVVGHRIITKMSKYSESMTTPTDEKVYTESIISSEDFGMFMHNLKIGDNINPIVLDKERMEQ